MSESSDHTHHSPEIEHLISEHGKSPVDIETTHD